MQNLNFPTQRILINTLSAAEIAMWTDTDPDTSATVRHLSLKKHGIDIPFVSGSTTIRKSCTQAGQLKSRALTILAPAPCEDCNYEYGITLKEIVREPGVMNADYYPDSRLYGGVLESIQTPSGGFLADSDKVIIETDIINQIMDDTTALGGFADARRIYTFTTGTNGDEAVSLYNSSGTLIVTVTLTNDATIAGAVNDLNADTTFDDYFYAMAISTTQVLITSINAGLIFTLEDGGGAHAIDNITREVWITSRNVNSQFEIEFDSGFATNRGLTIQALDAATNDAGTLTYYINGTAYGYTAGAHDPAGYVAGFNADGASLGAYACLRLTAATTIWIYGNGDITDITWASFGVTGIVKLNYTTWGHPIGRFPRLTADDVFRLFLNDSGLGALSNMTYIVQPTEDATYCKLHIEYTASIGAIHGASHEDNHKSMVDIYIKSGLFATSLWDANNPTSGQYMAEAADTGFSADTAFDALLDAWYGSNLGYSWPS